jgi:hypothetical protein
MLGLNFGLGYVETPFAGPSCVAACLNPAESVPSRRYIYICFEQKGANYPTTFQHNRI